jgi:hypothetical protein
MGFRYLVTAIELGLQTPDIVYRITDLYDAVAAFFNTTGVKVERSIRYSIRKTNLTNKEFISRAIDHLSPPVGDISAAI